MITHCNFYTKNWFVKGMNFEFSDVVEHQTLLNRQFDFSALGINTILICLLVVLILNIILLFSVAKFNREFKKIKSNLTEQIYSQSIEIEQTEKNKVAMFLHDEIGNDLIGMCYHIQDKNHVETIKSVYRKVRELSHELSSIEIDEKKTIEDIIDTLVSDTFTDIEVDNKMEISILKKELLGYKLAHFYRVLQEIFLNVKKHSKSNYLILKSYVKDDLIFIEIINNGVSFLNAGNKGIGQRNIQNRLNIWSGSFDFFIKNNFAHSVIKLSTKNF